MSPNPETTLDADFEKYNEYMSKEYSFLSPFLDKAPSFKKQNNQDHNANFSKQEISRINFIKGKCTMIQKIAKGLQNLADSLFGIAELALERIEIEIGLRSSNGQKKEQIPSEIIELFVKKESPLPKANYSKKSMHEFGEVKDWGTQMNLKQDISDFIEKEEIKQKMKKDLHCRKTLVQHELVTKSIQECPIVDRMGRMLIDLAPHIALFSNGYDSINRLFEFSDNMEDKSSLGNIFGIERGKPNFMKSAKEGRKSRNKEPLRGGTPRNEIEGSLSNTDRVFRNPNNSLNERTNRLLGVSNKQDNLGIFDRAVYYCSEEFINKSWKENHFLQKR